jgi:hypothetical protein
MMEFTFSALPFKMSKSVIGLFYTTKDEKPRLETGEFPIFTGRGCPKSSPDLRKHCWSALNTLEQEQRVSQVEEANGQ